MYRSLRLLRPVAVGGGHVPADLGQSGVILGRHVRRDVRHRVAVRPHDQPAVLVERDGRPDLLTAVDHAAGHEVAHRAVLGRRERARSAVGDGLRVRAGPPAATPAVAVVAIEVGADRRRARGRLAVLAPVVEVPAGDVVLGAIGVDHEHDPDLAACRRSP